MEQGKTQPLNSVHGTMWVEQQIMQEFADFGSE
jgi:hypothetical protein